MKIIDSDSVNKQLSFKKLIPYIEKAFAGNANMPQRHVYALNQEQSHSDGLAILQAWNDTAIAVKAFTYFPRNAGTELETLYSKIMLFSRKTGEPLALVDGTSITYWRTAAVSAIAANFLSRQEASTLFICGTGRLAPYIAEAISHIRAIKTIIIWGRNSDKALNIVNRLKLKLPNINIQYHQNRQQAAEQADIISCATNAREPLIFGEWIKPGTHTDFVGSHEPDRRECDSELIGTAKLFVDSRSNVLAEAGDLIIPIKEGRISEHDIQAELSELCRGTHPGRQHKDEITLFKSVGTALSDLAAAMLVFENTEA